MEFSIMKILDPFQIYGAKPELKLIGKSADNNNVSKGQTIPASRPLSEFSLSALAYGGNTFLRSEMEAQAL